MRPEGARPGRVVVVAAMEGELKFLTRGWARERRGGVTLWRRPPSAPGGAHEGPGPGLTARGADAAPPACVAACAGAGGAAALRALAEAERDGPADRLLSVGWAGALDGTCLPGRAYRVGGVVDALSGERFTTAGGAPGPVLVSAPAVAGAAAKKALALAHGAQLVDMEAAALARLAAGRGVPLDVVKGVSDGPGERLPDFGRFFDPRGRFRFAPFIAFALCRPGLWSVWMRLGRDSRGAAISIAEVLRAQGAL